MNDDTPPPSTAASEFTDAEIADALKWLDLAHARYACERIDDADREIELNAAKIIRYLLSRLSAGSPDNSAAHGPKLVESTRVEEGTNTPQSKAGSTPAGGASERLSAGEGGPLVAEIDDSLHGKFPVAGTYDRDLLQRARDELVRQAAEIAELTMEVNVRRERKVQCENMDREITALEAKLAEAGRVHRRIIAAAVQMRKQFGTASDRGCCIEFDAALAADPSRSE